MASAETTTVTAAEDMVTEETDSTAKDQEEQGRQEEKKEEQEEEAEGEKDQGERGEEVDGGGGGAGGGGVGEERVSKEETVRESGSKTSNKRSSSGEKRTVKNTLLNYFKCSPRKSKPEASSEASKKPSRKTSTEELEDMWEDERVWKIRRHGKSQTWRRRCERDTLAYRSGYPNKKDHLNLKENRLFYTNKIPSRPRGALIDTIHKDWTGNYRLLEEHHGYIQWLFPIREEGMNLEAQELQLHEAEAIQKDEAAKARVLKSFEMMLDFFGMELVDAETGKIERSKNWRERYANLKRMRHNYMRITRILKSLGELGFEHLKAPWVHFLLTESLEKRALPTMVESAVDYWIYTVRDDDDRQKLIDYAAQYVEDM